MARVYRLVYREVVKTVGGDAAYLLAELAAYAKFCEKNGYLSASGWFEISEKQIEEFTGFERTKQYRELLKLDKYGFLCMRNKNGVGREFKINPEPARICAGNPRENEQGTRANMRRYPREYAQVFIYLNSFLNSYLISCCNKEKQQQIVEKVFLYFCSKIPDEKKACDEAAAFIQYNRENYGEDHINGRNYKKHADGWINNINNKPKKKSKGRSNKTAAEAAKAQGVTVGEFLNIEPLPVKVTKKDIENTPDIFGELFGGEK